MRLRVFLFLSAFLALEARGIFAQVRHEYSITTDPYPLFHSGLILNFEKRMSDKSGIELITNPYWGDGAFGYELGGMWKYYLIGSFEHALQTGVELFYNHPGAYNDPILFIGPILGYKYIAPFGLTLDLSTGAGLGYEFPFIHRNYSYLIYWDLNLNVGWSF